MDNAVTKLTLGDLLDDENLGLLLSAGSDVGQRPVRSAQRIEPRRAATQYERDAIVVMTARDLDGLDIAAVVAELEHAGAAAVGFGIEEERERLPADLLGAASSCGLPVVEIPFETSLQELLATVQRNVLSSEARAYGRLAAMQRFLVASITEDDPAACVVQRLSTLLDIEVAVVDQSGCIADGACSVDERDLAALLGADGSRAIRVDEADFAGWALPIAVSPVRTNWLLAGVSGGRREPPLTKSAAQIAVPLIAAAAQLDEARDTEREAVRKATLGALVDATSTQEAEFAAARAATWGMRIESGVRALVCRTRVTCDERAVDLIDEIEETLSSRCPTWLATSRGDDVVVLLRSVDVDEELTARLLDLHPHSQLGVGRIVTDAIGVRRSYADAELITRNLLGRDGLRLLRYDDLELSEALVSEVAPERIRAKVDRWLKPLAEYPAAYETLVTYLDSDLDVGRTSRKLNLHPNSTRYRLARIEELLGAPLRRPATIASLHFALLAEQYGVASEVAGEAGDADTTDAHLVA